MESISPVNATAPGLIAENEVDQAKTFFERIATTLVAHSQQVRELADIRHSLNELSSRVDRLTTENNNLREDLSNAWNSFEREKQGRIQAEAQAQAAVAEAQQARASAEQARQEHERRAAMAQDQIDQRDARIRELEEKLAASRSDAYDWTARSNRWEKLAKENDAKLATVQGHLNEMNDRLRSLFQSTVAETPKVEEPAPQPEPKPEPFHGWSFAAND